MILSDGEIQEAIHSGEIIIKPTPTEKQFTTSALDLFLGDEIRELKTPEELQKDEPPGVHRPLIVNLAEVNAGALIHKYGKPVRKEEDGSFIFNPGKFVLGITKEWIELPRESKIAARVEGRSTLARLGLIVHLTAPTIHAGFKGQIVLEMCNLGPYQLKLIPERLAICQLIFERLGKSPLGDVKTKYQGQTSLT